MVALSNLQPQLTTGRTKPDEDHNEIPDAKDHAATLARAPIAMTRQGLADKAAGQADVAGQQIELLFPVCKAA